MTVGLMISRLIRFAISGTLPDPDGNPEGHTGKQCLILLGVTLPFAVLVLALNPVVASCGKKKDAHPCEAHFAVMCQNCCTMVLAWNLLFLGQWVCYYEVPKGIMGQGSKMASLVVIAVVESVCVYVGIFVLGCLANHCGAKGARSLL